MYERMRSETVRRRTVCLAKHLLDCGVIKRDPSPDVILPAASQVPRLSPERVRPSSINPGSLLMTDESLHASLSRNRILAALPERERERLLQHMRKVLLQRGQILIAPGEPITGAYFPLDSMISLVTLMRDGLMTEAGTVGCEGVLGLPVLFGVGVTPMQSMVQIPGEAVHLGGDVFKKEFDLGGPLRDLLLLYAQALFVAVSQSAACNARHPVEQRLCRWLLLSSDAVRSDGLPLTQEFLSAMLGVRRAGVSVAASGLRREGLIAYTRGRVSILDRAGLERGACECYGVVKSQFDRLPGPPPLAAARRQ